MNITSRNLTATLFAAFLLLFTAPTVSASGDAPPPSPPSPVGHHVDCADSFWLIACNLETDQPQQYGCVEWPGGYVFCEGTRILNVSIPAVQHNLAPPVFHPERLCPASVPSCNDQVFHSGP